MKNNKEANLEESEIEKIEETLDEVETELDSEESADQFSFEELDAKIELLTEENKKLREDYIRAFADAENTKKRALQEIEKNNKFAISSFAKNLLSVADNLQRAIDSVKTEDEASCQNLLMGIKLTQDELMKTFEKFGVKKMDIMGKPFDPNFHQVVQEIEDKQKPAGTIVAELQSGYMIQDRILREAMVVISK